tara:strand:+ start:3993 stop:4202 length:210 start_codon:yes stop_codon:yes gene_type:complete
LIPKVCGSLCQQAFFDGKSINKTLNFMFRIGESCMVLIVFEAKAVQVELRGFDWIFDTEVIQWQGRISP